MSMKADVVIIGSGVIGNSTAYYLAKKGKSVIVLEKSNDIGDGGSSRNGGGVRQSGRHPMELPLAIYGVQNLWPNLSEELGVDVEYFQEGNLRLGKTEAHLDILKDIVERGKAGGLELDMVTGDEARGICSHLSDEVLGASWCPTDGHANPMLTTLAYYRKAKQMGVRFITGETVVAIKKIKGKAREVVTQDNVYEGETIVLAAGFGSRKIAATIGIDVPMIELIMEVLVTEAQPEMFYQMLGTAAADFYGHQSPHGSFVFGGTSGHEAYNRGDKVMATSSMTAPCICRGIMKYFPQLEDAKIVRTWAGSIDDCVDHIPVISYVEEVPGLILACGFSGHGFGISPTVGMLLAEMVEGKETTLDISGFRYDRFKAKI